MALGIRLPARTSVALLVVALACAALALLPDSAGAQTPPTWDNDGELRISASSVQTDGVAKCLVWTSGVTISLYNVDIPVHAACAADATGTNSDYFLLYAAPSSASLEDAAEHVNRVRLTNSTGSNILNETSPGWTVQPVSPAEYGGATQRLITKQAVSSSTFGGWTAGDVILYAESANADTPSAPIRITSTRSADSATISWELFDPVVEYEIEREQAITIEAQQTATTQYGNTTRFLVEGTIAGVDRYVDSTVDARYTYRYRVRARGTDNDSWSAFCAWAVAGSDTGVDLDAPASLEVFRARDNTAVTIDWTAPDGPVDGYAVQRQELVVVEGSTIFANTNTLTSDLGADTLSYTDDTISPGRTYEYRVAATQDGVVGDYSDWARVSPYVRTFGTAPQNLHLVEDGTAKVLDDRREFWMRWDEVDGADDYEVEVRVYDSAGDRSLERYVYTDPSYFRTAFGRVEMRTRGRLLTNDGLCGDGDGSDEPGEDCHTEWTGWYGVGFSPKVAPEPGATPLPDTSIEEFQDDVDALVNQTLDQSGVDVDPSVAVQFAVLVGTAVVATGSIVAGWKRGMRPLGVGMAFSVMVVSLYLAHRLLGIPVAWPIGAQALIVIPGLVAFARQAGAFR